MGYGIEKGFVLFFVFNIVLVTGKRSWKFGLKSGEEDRGRRDVLLLLCVIIQIMLREATVSVPEEPGSRALPGDGGGNKRRRNKRDDPCASHPPGSACRRAGIWMRSVGVSENDVGRGGWLWVRRNFAVWILLVPMI